VAEFPRHISWEALAFCIKRTRLWRWLERLIAIMRLVRKSSFRFFFCFSHHLLGCFVLYNTTKDPLQDAATFWNFRHRGFGGKKCPGIQIVSAIVHLRWSPKRHWNGIGNGHHQRKYLYQQKHQQDSLFTPFCPLSIAYYTPSHALISPAWPSK